MSGAPCRTRSPATTRIFVICPSIWGCTVVDFNDLSDATYSLASSIGAGCAAASTTGVGGMPCPCAGAAGARLQPLMIAARPIATAILMIVMFSECITRAP